MTSNDRPEPSDATAPAEAAGEVRGAEQWDARYATGDTRWDLGVAAPPLVRAFDALPPSRAMVVGCGLGNEVLALATRGFEVVGVDFAARAVKAASERAKAAGLRATFRQADLFDLPADLMGTPLWVEHTCFCAIDPARRGEYAQAAARAIAPGGLLLGLFYAHGRPGGPPFTTTQAEVERLFAPHFEIESAETPPDSHPRRAGEERLIHLRRR